MSDIEIEVFRNDEISIDEIEKYDKILLSPGPGLPKDAGIMPELLKRYSSTKSILGVCLGLQAIGESFGANLMNLDTVFHGLATPITVNVEDIIFNNCPKTFTVGRYHSWVVDTHFFPEDLQITATDENGNIMALKHKIYDVRGVQFHPESILSEYGEILIENWLNS